MSDTYFKITEKEKSSCFSSSMVQNIPGMICVLSDARDMQEKHERLDANVMVRLGVWKPISDSMWETMVQQSRNGQSNDAFADINVDECRVVLSDWLVSRSGRTEVTGELDELVKCYKESLDGGRLNQERFAIALFDLCEVQIFDTQHQQQAAENMEFSSSPAKWREPVDENTMREFIGNLLGETEPKSMEAWRQYAVILDQTGTEKASDFYRDLCGELEYIKEKSDVETARKLFNMGQDFTLNPFELRTAALLLLSGVPESGISNLAAEDDLFSLMRRESGSFPNPLPEASPLSAVGRVIFHGGETREYTDALEYVNAVKGELPYANSTGFHYETFAEEPMIRNALDNLLHHLAGEDYQKSDPSMGMGGINQ